MTKGVVWSGVTSARITVELGAVPPRASTMSAHGRSPVQHAGVGIAGHAARSSSVTPVTITGTPRLQR